MAGMVMDIIFIDHCYSKPWSAHPDATNARPLKTIYMKKFPRISASDIPKIEPEPVIDVTSVQPNIPHYDVSKGKVLMNECEKHMSSLRDDADWEELINKSGWTPQQNWLANKAIKMLHSDRLFRLAYDNNINEPVLRRIHIDKTAKRFRQALSSVGWDIKLIQWLHGVLMDNLGTQYLAAYLDILQTLRAKIPQLIDRMMSNPNQKVRAPNLTGEPLSNLVKRPWDPVLNAYSQNKMRKLPFNPLILVAPSGPTTNTSLQSKRMRYYTSQFSSLGKVIPVTMHTVNGGSGVSIAQCLEHMIGAVKTKVVELKGHFSNRPIVLMGWNIGALVSCHVALQESVSAVVCLGFPFTGVGGGRGDADDPLLESRTPTLFVIGQHATTCTIDEMEDLREKMKADNSLLVVGGADDQLRVSRAKKKREGFTQIMVDKTILDEVSEFLGGILSQGPIIHESVIVDLSDIDIKKKKKYQTETMDSIDLTTNSTPAQNSPQNMTIANALRAQALASSVSPSSQTKIGPFQLAATSTATSPIRVKRKYTKRKAINKPVSAAPRKRFKSTPTPPVASPVAASVQTPLSAGLHLSSPGTQDLTGLLKPTTGLLPLLDTVQQQAPSLPTPKSSQAQHTLASNLPSSSILGPSNEPMVAYRLEDYCKRFGPQVEPAPSKPTISIEGLLQSPGPSYLGDIKSPLLQISRQRPQVHVTTASSVTSHIHQLLANISKSAGLTSLSTASSSSMATLTTPSKSTPLPETVTSPISLTPAQISQSGSPLQNSVPTLMSSLNKSSGYNIGNMIKIITSTAAASHGSGLKPDFEESLAPTGQKLHHEVPVNISTSTAIPSIIPRSDNSIVLPPSPAVEPGRKAIISLGETPTSTLSKTDEVFSHMISSIAAAKGVSNVTFPPEFPMPSTQRPLFSPSIKDSKERVLSMGQTSQDTALSKDNTIHEASIITGQPQCIFSSNKAEDTTFWSATDAMSRNQANQDTDMSSQDETVIDLTVSKSRINQENSLFEGQLGNDDAATSIDDKPTRLISTTTSEEILGKVSLLESNPAIEKPTMASVGTDTPVLSRPHGNQGISVSVATGFPQKPPAIRNASPALTSYTATPKQSLATLAATRTRRIRTPKQFDL